MIIGVISGYNDAPFLEGCLGGIAGSCDHFVYVDGVYDGFPWINASAASTDDSISIAKRWGATIIKSPPNGWRNQIEKRNQYLIGEEGDWYLMVDCDEIFEGVLPKNPLPDTGAFNIFVYSAVTGSKTPWLRFFAHAEGLRYEGGHNILWAGDEMIVPGRCDVLRDARINHYKHLRSKDRKLKKQKYHPLQFKSERQYRLLHNCP